MCGCRATAKTRQAVAEFLEQHPQDRLGQLSAACQGDQYYALAQKYLPNGSCGVVSFGLKGGREAAETFMRHSSWPPLRPMWLTPAPAA